MKPPLTPRSPLHVPLPLRPSDLGWFPCQAAPPALSCREGLHPRVCQQLRQAGGRSRRGERQELRAGGGGEGAAREVGVLRR